MSDKTCNKEVRESINRESVNKENVNKESSDRERVNMESSDRESANRENANRESVNEKVASVDKFSLLSERDRLKYEIAEELGILDKVRKYGWKSLSAKESGKIGGIMTARLKEKMREDTGNR